MKNVPSIRFVGGIGSPYSKKMLALLRYRRIPYSVTWGYDETIKEICGTLDIDPPKVFLLPTFFFENGNDVEVAVDSTPIIRRLEAMQETRSVLPQDPALGFIDYLVEDFADEWCTKYMFHYRWHFNEDAENAAKLLPLGFDVSMHQDQLDKLSPFLRDRQTGRLYVVGSNNTTAPIIDASFRRFLTLMENHLVNQRYSLGNRPGAGDFALYGQLSQLVGWDPTPRSIAHKLAPRVVAWVDHMSDQSGLEPTDQDWTALEDQPDTLRDLIGEIGRVYVPAQLANAKAAQAGEKTWEAEIDGAAWSQQTFPYQAKCLRWTNAYYHTLSSQDRERVDNFLKGTGVEAMLFPAP